MNNLEIEFDFTRNKLKKLNNNKKMKMAFIFLSSLMTIFLATIYQFSNTLTKKVKNEDVSFKFFDKQTYDEYDEFSKIDNLDKIHTPLSNLFKTTSLLIYKSNNDYSYKDNNNKSIKIQFSPKTKEKIEKILEETTTDKLIKDYNHYQENLKCDYNILCTYMLKNYFSNKIFIKKSIVDIEILKNKDLFDEYKKLNSNPSIENAKKLENLRNEIWLKNKDKLSTD